MTTRSWVRPGAPLRARLTRRDPVYYGWVLVVTLGFTEAVSYGVLSYAFPVFLAPMEAELGWSRTALTGAFSLAFLVAGLAALPVGRWMDRHGARVLMTAGSLAAAALVAAWSGVESLATYYAVWVGIGLASAMVLYEPAFALVANWFDRRRGSALTVLTVMGGFASVVFVPLASVLVERLGWRGALLVLAGVLAVCTAVPHAVLLRRRPSDLGLLPDGEVRLAEAPAAPAPASVAARDAVRSRSFVLLTAAFSLATFVTTGLTVHLVPLLLERGADPTSAAAALGAVGLMALPGRVVLTPLGSRWNRTGVTCGIFVLQALGIAALIRDPGTASLWAFIVLFGAGFGAITPARAALVAELYGPADYGRIGGVLALFLALSRAAAPVGTSLLYTALGGYGGVLWALGGVSALAGAAIVLTGRRRLGRPTPC